MEGAHDMGGVAGFGPVVQEPNEPVFHADWERRVFALTLAMGKPGGWNIDMSRFAREDRPPSEYLAKTYFEIWLAGLERLMAERDLVQLDEIAAGHPLHPIKSLPILKAADVAPMLRRGGPTLREAPRPARFAIGASVRARTLNPPSHIRLPRYVRGHLGVIERIHGCHVLPDSNARGAGEDPQWLYTVSFDGRELFGAEGDASVKTSVDAFEPYLEPA
jgi:nitrile hydratase